MRHIRITSFAIRLAGLALLVHLLRDGFDIGTYADQAFGSDLSSEPSFRFEGIYLLHASREFYLTAFILKMLGSFLLFAFPRPFARILWAGLAPEETKIPPYDPADKG